VTVTKNGVDDGTVTPAVTHPGTGHYRIAVPLPGGYASGDTVNLSIAATVATVADTLVLGPFVLDSKRVGDLVDAAAPDNADIVTALGDLVTLLARTDPTTTLAEIGTDIDAIETRLTAAVPGSTPVLVIAAPFSPSQSIGYTYCYDAAGNLDAKAQIEFSMVTPPATTDGTSYATYLTRKPYLLTDADPAKRGRLDVTLLKGATYRAKRTDDGVAVTILVPDTDTFQLPQTLARPAFQ
jgi:hypothetical protein